MPKLYSSRQLIKTLLSKGFLFILLRLDAASGLRKDSLPAGRQALRGFLPAETAGVNPRSFISQKGSHVKFRKTGRPTLTVIIPAGQKEIPFGTFKSILRQANLAAEDFK